MTARSSAAAPPSIGFMQGRLSPLVDGRIQAFPWEHWRAEFPAAQTLDLRTMEWTLDQERIHENPLLSGSGRREILQLRAQFGVDVPSLTADFVMQAPFFKCAQPERCQRLDTFRAVLDACAALEVRFIVVPLVDGGSLRDERDAASLREGLDIVLPTLADAGIIVAFESDFLPDRLAALIDDYPAERFGINYDIGNSASLGFDPGEEMGAYAARIVNVHVKDRLRGGTTVPLGTGHADLPRVFRLLRRTNYGGNFILQTARAQNGDHAGTLAHYRDMTLRLWNEAA